MHTDVIQQIKEETREGALERLRSQGNKLSEGVLNTIFGRAEKGVEFFSQGMLTRSLWCNALLDNDVIDVGTVEKSPSVLIPARFDHPPLMMSHALAVGRGFIPANIESVEEKQALNAYWNSAIEAFRAFFPRRANNRAGNAA